MSEQSKPDPLEQLAKNVAEGKVKIVGVRIRVCGHCKVGTLHHSGTPNWMNRFTCDHCGKHVSR